MAAFLVQIRGAERVAALADCPVDVDMEDQEDDVIEIDIYQQDFSQLSALEDWARTHPELEVSIGCVRSGQGLNFLSEDRPVGIRPARTNRQVEVTAPPVTRSTCGQCLRRTVSRDPTAATRLRFTSARPPDLLGHSSYSVFASERLLAALTEAGHDVGLQAHPISDVRGSSLRWFWLAGAAMCPPAGPFGVWRAACVQCGRPPVRRYEAGDIYQRPTEPAGWMEPHSSLYALAPIMVTGRIYRWLMGPGSRFVGESALESRLSARVFGWYPQDVGFFYLPRCFHASDSEVVDASVLEKLAEDALPSAGNPPPDPEPRWRTVALERGLFHSLDRALGWSHDLVYILDLSGQADVTELREDELAAFRNLEALHLRGTCVSGLPPCVAELANLRVVDVRQTELAPEAVESLKNTLGTRVRVLAGADDSEP